MPRLLLPVAYLVALVPFAVPVRAQEESAYDRVWRVAEWYRNDNAPAVQSVLFSGRFQFEYARVSDEGVTHDEWNVRRLRLGWRIGLFRQVTLHAEAELNPQERDPLYMRLTDAYVEWSRSSAVALTLGKQGVPFTMDGSTSSKELLTIDRSNLANNMWFPEEYMPGVSAAGSVSQWSYQVGVYSAGARDRELGDFSGSGFVLVALGRDLSQDLGVDVSVVTASYLYQEPDANNTFTRPLDHVGSLNLRLEDGRWGVRTDLAAASGYLGQSRLWGAMVMPYFTVTSGFQLVARHTYLESSELNGVRLARYESQLTGGRGDRYNEVYLGANYYIYGHKLKLQAGAQLASMKDRADDGGAYSGLGATVGVRVSW
jgi:phosphate-selective porin OprO/OprP